MDIVLRGKVYTLPYVKIDRQYSKYACPNDFRFSIIRDDFTYGNAYWFCIDRLPDQSLHFYVDYRDIDGSYGRDAIEVKPEDQDYIQSLLNEFLENEED